MEIQSKAMKEIRELINEKTEHRSGPKLVSFFNELGFDDLYVQAFPPRWCYTEICLEKINGTVRMEECIIKLFAPVDFIGEFGRLDKLIKGLNRYLSFDDYKVVRKGKLIEIEIIGQDADITTEPSKEMTEDDFLKKEFKEISISGLYLEGKITKVLNQRLEEIKKCLNSGAALATIFLCGSTLEGILFGVATSTPQEFNSSTASPKDEEGKALQFQDWTLANFIDVAKEVGFLEEDVKKFSHHLRDFRNYIHPYKQISNKFNPDVHTAELCWQVLRLAIVQITKNTF